MRSALFTIRCFLLLVASLQSYRLGAAPTVLKYKITNDGKEIGEIRAQRTLHGSQVIFDTETKMTIRVVLKQDIVASIHSVYQNGTLQNSTAKTMVNGGLHNKCTVIKKANQYEIQRDNKSHKVSGAINYSGVMIYFKEPQHNTPVFSEMNGHQNHMHRISAQHYKLVDPKKSKDNLYWYKGGILQRAILHHALLNIEIERIN